jgi:hypothetical protein
MKLFPATLLSLLLAFSMGQALAQSPKGNGNVITQQREVKAFTGVEAGGLFDVFIIWGDRQKVVIEADENLQRFIKAEVKNGVLHLSQTQTLKNVTKLKAYVTTDVLSSLEISGAADVECSAPLQSKSLKIVLSGAGDLDLKVVGERLDCEVTGASTVRIGGTVKEIHMEVSGSGDLVARDLLSEVGHVSVTGNADVYVHLTREIHAKITGAGNVYCSGNPAVRDVQVSGLGEVTYK